MCIDIQCAVGWDDFGLFEIPQVALVQIDDFPEKLFWLKNARELPF